MKLMTCGEMAINFQYENKKKKEEVKPSPLNYKMFQDSLWSVQMFTMEKDLYYTFGAWKIKGTDT